MAIKLKLRAPKLKEIPLDGTCDNKHITTKKHYMIAYVGAYDVLRYYSGQFEKQWYGWNFDGVYEAGVQLNDPDILALWEILP